MSLTLQQVYEKVKEQGDPELAYVNDAPIHYIVLNHADYTFTADKILQHVALLEKIEATKGPGVVVTVSTSPKIFSTGFNLPYWMEKTDNFLVSVGVLNLLIEKLVTFPLPTMAVINGHAYAGGAILALLHDFRIMNSQKGNVCLSEATVGQALPTACAAVCMEKMGK